MPGTSRALLPPSTPPDVTPLTSARLTYAQYKAIEALIYREESESLGEVASRAGVTRITLWRWLKQPEFVAELKARVEIELGSQRANVARALVQGAIRPGNGQAAMQKIYWQRLGELVERSEVAAQVQVESSGVIDQLPPEGKRRLIELLEEHRVQLAVNTARNVTPTGEMDVPDFELDNLDGTQPAIQIVAMPDGYVDDGEDY